MSNMKVHILTYATHSEGMYEQMLKDAKTFRMQIKTLGWGEKWKGYYGKLKAVYKEINKYNPEDIVVVVDGFDTRINQSVDSLVTLYLKHYPFKSVFSKDPSYNMVPYVPNFVDHYVRARIFGNCTVNAGGYMGRVSDIKSIVLKAINLEKSCNGDDQLAFCKLQSDLVIDERRLIFKNLTAQERRLDTTFHTDAIFISYPGTPTNKRIFRAIVEYSPFFYREIVAILVLLIIGIVFSFKDLIFQSTANTRDAKEEVMVATQLTEM